jgi:hypothetical protein
MRATIGSLATDLYFANHVSSPSVVFDPGRRFDLGKSVVEPASMGWWYLGSSAFASDWMLPARRDKKGARQ